MSDDALRSDAEEHARRIDSLYEEASNNPCTCNSSCEYEAMGCPYCGAWAGARSACEEILVEALTTYRTAQSPMSDEIKALVERARNRINDAPLETERLIDDLADCVEALSIPSDGQFVFLDEYPGKGAPLRKVTKDEALKLFHERLTAQADEIERLKKAYARYFHEAADAQEVKA